jgi:Ca2+:H+ antiporter
MRHWPLATPVLALTVLAISLSTALSGVVALACAAALIGAVIAAVHHAEVVAHRVGEPFGTLVLAVAVTVIEVALIVSMMLAGGAGKAALPRDTVFSAVMIICTGVLGLCVLAGGMRHREQHFRLDGASPGLAALVALAGLTLAMPSFTTSSAGPTYTESQLAFVAISSLVLWAVYVFVQTVRHRDYFLPPDHADDETHHASPPTTPQAWTSFALLVLSLVTVVGLAKQLSPVIEAGVTSAGAPKAVIGIAIALLVLLPETWAAIRAARANRLQTSVNLALGSALASIGLTIPVVVVTAVWLDLPLVLGLPPKDLLLMMLTFLVSAITLGTGRTSVMQGAVHVVLFAAFLFLSLVP